MDSNKIKEWRKAKGLTQKELAGLCGVTNSAVSAWETGRDQPSGAALKTLEGLMLGTERTIHPLSEFDATILDELVKRSGAQSREDYLTAQLRAHIERESAKG